MGLDSAPDLKPVIPVTYLDTAPDNLVVACVYWGDKYPIGYVERLYNSVKRNLTVPFRFACLTDQEVNIPGVETYRTKYDWPGWWQKVGLFDPGLFTGKRVLYFDLDVVICRSIYNLALVADPIALVENFSPNRGRSAHNSSIMVWDSDGPAQAIFREFEKDPDRVMENLHGDQCWIWRVMSEQGHDIPNFPRREVQSFKYDTLRGVENPQCIVFHGKPDPHEVDHPLVREHWR